MSDIKNIPVIQETDPKRSNPLAGVFDDFIQFCQSRSLFMLHYCTGCGAIELPPAMTSRFDMERLGIQPMVTPRQADILLVTGYVSVKTLKRVILTYEQMQSPKYVIGICSCTVNGGMYWQSYATAKVLNEYLPVDVYIAGCMPRPEAVIEGLKRLRGNIERGEANAWKTEGKISLADGTHSNETFQTAVADLKGGRGGEDESASPILHGQPPRPFPCQHWCKPHTPVRISLRTTSQGPLQ